MPLGFEGKMQVGDADPEQSSSSISSPPISPQNHSSDTIHVVSKPSQPAFGLSSDGVATGTSAQAAQATNSNVTISTNTTMNGAASEKPKKPRKKKEVGLGPDGKPIVEEKPKRPRKPKEPKKVDGANGTTTTAAPRKKAKTEPKTEQKAEGKVQSNAIARQPTITDMVGGFQQPSQPASSIMQSQIQHRTSDGIIRNSLPQSTTSNPSTPRPVSSGQNYDPIRGSTMDARPSTLNNAMQPTSSPPPGNRTTASPAISIANLIDPPAATKTATQTSPYSRDLSMQPPISQQSPPPKPIFAPPPAKPSPPSETATPAIPSIDGAMEVELSCELPKPPVPEIKAPSKSSSSAAATPKPRPEAPKATGSGLLSSSDLFGGPSTNEPSDRKGVNIDIHIPLNPKGGNTINIAQEIIKKYGRDAINPRAAAHREQLLRIAAEQDRLGGASNDEMSVDLLSEVEGDSNVEMGGMDDDKSNTGLEAGGGAAADGEKQPPRKRRKKVEEYDKEDDFIDDTELAWQEQAAVAKDGFFVYSGPLVPEGQAPQVESAAASKSSRGRGRGARSKASAAGTTHASLAEKKEASTTNTTATTGERSGGTTRSRGTRGGRGTGAPRKARTTKAEKEKIEAEKAEREKVGAAATGINGSSAATPAVSTPMSTAMASGQQPQLPSPLQQQHAAQTYTSKPLTVE